MNWFGFLVGVVTFFIIGLGFVWVILGERYFGCLWWPYVMGLGVLCVVGSLFVSSNWGAVLLGSVGASLFWGSTELKEQAIRGELGWYPFHGEKTLPPFADVIKRWKAPSL
jgi:hypothetical protein